MNYTVKSSADVGMSVGKVKGCRIMEMVLNGCFIIVKVNLVKK